MHDDEYEAEHAGHEFDHSEEQSDQFLKGTRLKFVDNVWFADGAPLEEKQTLMVEGTTTIIERWEGKQLLEKYVDKPLPDLKLLNGAVPQSEWPIGLDGKPEQPYKHYRVVSFRNLATMECSSFISPAKGAARAVAILRDRVNWLRKMRSSNNLFPLVELISAPWPTRFGMKKRPEFHVVGWVDLSDGSTLPAMPGPKQLPPVEVKKVEAPKPKDTTSTTASHSDHPRKAP